MTIENPIELRWEKRNNPTENPTEAHPIGAVIMVLVLLVKPAGLFGKER